MDGCTAPLIGIGEVAPGSAPREERWETPG